MKQAQQSGTPFFFAGQDSHVGYDRLVNEDYYGNFSTPAGELFVVADGLSGHAGGGVASRLAVSAFRDFLSSVSGEPEEFLIQAAARADQAVIAAGEKYPELDGLGVSLVALLLRNNEAWFIHVGDSRLYLCSASGLRRLTKDHTVGRAGDGPGTEGRLLTQSLGGFVDIGSLRVGRHTYRADDSFLLCTQGLPLLATDAEIRDILSLPYTPQERARILLEVAVEKGGAENITVQVVSFKPGDDDEDEPWPAGRVRGPLCFLLGFGCGLLAAGLGRWLWPGYF
ncbi:MAG: protein phosphatase 2C domain-containing protein [Candidatus Adiutrix sp.]|jgi:serine/threonine protein phosphatase PrpC|nr:protein phosphatase 2C domain-containing protein [Candidatus Adiutrix sp.]